MHSIENNILKTT